MPSFRSIHSEFWIGTHTEAQNQPHFSGDDVPYAELYCLSFKPSFVGFGWKNSSLFFASHRRRQIIQYACRQILFNSR